MKSFRQPMHVLTGDYKGPLRVSLGNFRSSQVPRRDRK